jgi:adenylosuccinate synthase
MPSLSVFGAQWGDEGKGKIIDLLAKDADVVVRYQGGPNAGHTVIVGDEKYVLHLIPSGILHAGKVNVIGNGVAVDPIALLAELDGLLERDVKVGPTNLRISASAHVIFGYHRHADNLSERWLGDGRIGTTGRGIGPCYADKAARTGLRLGDLTSEARCRERLRAALAEKNALFERVHGSETFEFEAELARYLALGERLRPFLTDTGAEVRAAHAAGRVVLFEGAQGVLLDVDHGTYPYVTSSNTGVNGVASGAGFPASRIERAIGIAKAYCTRVGEGPFPTEDHGAGGERLAKGGHEFGATTGRPRRCGWFDAPAVRYAFELNGATSWVMTKLDVLSGMDEIPVCVGYELDSAADASLAGAVDGRLAYWPTAVPLDGLRPVYERLPGWTEDVREVRRFEDLPANARAYVTRLEELVGVPVEKVSVGPERDEIADRRPLEATLGA